MEMSELPWTSAYILFMYALRFINRINKYCTKINSYQIWANNLIFKRVFISFLEIMNEMKL